jgi:cytochrome c
VKGLHDIYLVFQNPGAKSGASLMVVMNTLFKSGETIKPQPAVLKPDTDFAIYTGKYKMTGLPFPYIEISLKEGKLMIDAGGQTGEIQPTGEPNQFDAGGKAKLLFIPDEANKINKLKMDAMGFSFEGVKE